MSKTRLCRQCKSLISGRSDKLFCTIKCKSDYHYMLNIKAKEAALKYDKILHRNRSILYEVMGDKGKRKQIDKILIDKANFKYPYITGNYKNSKGKTFNVVYDYAWMEFSTGKLLIIKRA